MPQPPALSEAFYFDLDLSAALRSTLLFVLGLSGPDHTSQPVVFEDLAHRMRKSRATLFIHFAALRAYKGALQVRYVSQGRIILIFASWLFADDFTTESRSLDFPLKEEEEDLTDLNSLKDLLLLNNKSPRIRIPGLAPVPELPEKLVSDLLAARIFPGLLPEIRDAGRSSEDLSALLAWVKQVQPKDPARLFMARLRMEAIPPDEYYHEACPACGKYGDHADDCHRRFFDPELMEC